MGEGYKEFLPENDERAVDQDSTGREKKKKGKKRSVGMEILSWIMTLLVAVVAALLIRAFIFEPVRVDGHSMDDTLADGEIMFVTKFDYSTNWLSFFWQDNETKENAPRLTFGGNPQRFDVVICRYPGRGDTNFVKRVAGLPGDTVSLQDGYLYINGEKFDEPYINDDYRTGSLNTLGEFRIPAKGDSLTISNNAVLVNGQNWPYRGTRLSGISDSGDRLEYSYDFTSNQGVLKLNGKKIETEEGLKAVDGVDYKLEQDYFFVMGDHRNNSNDSRSQGPIDRSMIVGHVRQVLFPFDKWRSVKNGLEY